MLLVVPSIFSLAKISEIQNGYGLAFFAFDLEMPCCVRKRISNQIAAFGTLQFALNKLLRFLLGYFCTVSCDLIVCLCIIRHQIPPPNRSSF